MTKMKTRALLALLITLATLLTTSNATHNPAPNLELAAIEAWLLNSYDWINRGWQAAFEVRTIYKGATPTAADFDSRLVPAATKQSIRDLLLDVTPLLEAWRALSGELAMQTALDPTDPDLGYLDQLLKAQLATMNALSSMLTEVLPDGMVDRMHFELNGEIASLWQAISGMLIRQLQENSVPLFTKPL